MVYQVCRDVCHGCPTNPDRAAVVFHNQRTICAGRAAATVEATAEGKLAFSGVICLPQINIICILEQFVFVVVVAAAIYTNMLNGGIQRQKITIVLPFFGKQF